MDAIWITVDASRLNAAVAESIRLSQRAPELVVASVAYHVVQRTIALTPSVPVSRIDTELGVMVAVRIGKRGQLLSTRGRGNTLKLGGRMGSGLMKNVPLTVLIIMARTRHDSFYNVSTNHRWELPAHYFKGMSRENFRSVMRAMENRMINARHSSIKFLIAGWVSVRNELLGRIYGGPPAVEGELDIGQSNKDFGRATWFRTSETAYVTIENMIGTVGGAMGDNSANYNRALFEHGLGPLQQAIDEETGEVAAHVWEKYQAEKIAPMWK